MRQFLFKNNLFVVSFYLMLKISGRYKLVYTVKISRTKLCAVKILDVVNKKEKKNARAK